MPVKAFDLFSRNSFAIALSISVVFSAASIATGSARAAKPAPTGGSAAVPPSSSAIDSAVDSNRIPDRGASIDQTYRAMHPPQYPADAKANGVTGTVVLNVLVGIDGNVKRVDVERSSGTQSLDAAAVNAAKLWRYRPAIREGKPSEGSIRIPIQF